MFITPYFGGCKYTNNFLFINKNIEFQWLGLLITLPDGRITTDNPQPPRGNCCCVFCPIHRTVVAETGVKPAKRRPLCSLFDVWPYSDSENRGKTREMATTVQSFDCFSVQRSEGVDF